MLPDDRAEYTLATILLSLKNYWFHAGEIKRTGRLAERIPCAGTYGSKVGLIPLGMIGRLVRDRLRAFDIEVLAYDPFVTPDEADRLGVELVSLDDIFRQCEVVILHTPWLKETEGMIQGYHFELMKTAPLSSTRRAGRSSVKMNFMRSLHAGLTSPRYST